MTPYNSNLRHSTYHMAMAISNLSTVLWLVAIGGDKPKPADMLATRMARAYQHMNMFWNGLSREGGMDSVLSNEELKEMSKFPLALYEDMALSRGKSSMSKDAAYHKEQKSAVELGVMDCMYATHHLTEAITDLSCELSKMAAGLDYSVPGRRLEVTIAHVYQHINWFWNGKSRQGGFDSVLSDDEYDEYSKFPVDLYELMDFQEGMRSWSEDPE